MLGFLRGPVPRLVAVGLMLLMFQLSLFAELRPANVVVHVLLSMAVAVGCAGGPEYGALAGFIFGLMLDLSIGTPIGSSAATMGLGGFVAGYVRSVAVDPHWWLSALFAMLGAAVATICGPIVRGLAGESQAITQHVVTSVVVGAVAAGLMSPLLVPIGRWCLRLKRPKWKAIPE